jgi:hypothetical protein
MHFNLAESVNAFALAFCDLTDADLDCSWQWGDYDEGVRFGFFRMYEDLRKLAVTLEVKRFQIQPQVSSTLAILRQYHAAYRDLQAVLIGVSDELANQKPAPEDWSLRIVMAHLVETDLSFWFINQQALISCRAGETNPPKLTEAHWEAMAEGVSFYKFAEEGPFSALANFYADHHPLVLHTFADATDAEIETPVWFWESQAMPMRFRLGRFDSHLRQHTIQAEKTLAALGHGPNEARRLLRLIFNALAEVEGSQIGMPELGQAECDLVAQDIASRQAALLAAIAA